MFDLGRCRGDWGEGVGGGGKSELEDHTGNFASTVFRVKDFYVIIKAIISNSFIVLNYRQITWKRKGGLAYENCLINK